MPDIPEALWSLAAPFFAHSAKRTGKADQLQTGLRPLSQPHFSLTAVTGLAAEQMQALQRDHSGLTGQWRKDRGRSDSMEEACALMQLPWMYRKAVLIVNNLEVLDNSELFRTATKVGGLFEMAEEYPWNGSAVKQKRRDRRRGQHEGHVARADDGAAIVKYTWNDPLGGTGSDVYTLDKDGALLVDVHLKRSDAGKECSYRSVFRRG